jgi:hypothetical protein
MVPTLCQAGLAFQNISYTGTAGTSTPIPAIDTNLRFVNVRILATSDCYYLVVRNDSKNQPVLVASSTVGSYLTALYPEYIRVPVGCVISVVQVAIAGTLNISPMQDVTAPN